MFIISQHLAEQAQNPREYGISRDDNWEIYVMNADGSDPILPVEVPEGWLTPVWRPHP